MKNFQTILMAVFLAIFVFGVMVFSGFIKIGTDSKDILKGKIVVWGVFGGREIASIIGNLSNDDLSIKYVQKEESEYEDNLIKAFATDTGPDLFFITPDMIIGKNNFIYKTLYESYPEKTFRDLYIDGADIYLDQEGVVGFPVVVDSMVMYYNKDILANEGIVSPPKYWDELFNLNPLLTKKENNGTIHQSMIALGQYGNINNAKEILSTLFIQNGGSVVSRTADDKKYISTLGDGTTSASQNGTADALSFYMGFSNPSNTAYSWNRSLPDSFDMFVSGKLVFYLGMASELFKIQSTNPNLSFDVTDIPQIKNTPVKHTYGKIYALAVSKRSKNIPLSLSVANLIMENDSIKNITVSLSLPPVSRALIAEKPANPYLFTFYNSAIISKSWIDPDYTSSSAIFSELIENILSNKLNIGEAISRAKGQLNIIINKKLYE